MSSGNLTPPLFGLEEVNALQSTLTAPQVSKQTSVDTPQSKAISTQSIKYTGSKLKLLPYILEVIEDLGVKKIWDAFSGSTRVSQAFAQRGYQVESNDIAAWSEQFAIAYLKNRENPSHYSDLIEHLNHLSPIDGWFTEHYGGIDNAGSSVQPDGRKRVWQIHNTRKLDAIRLEIDRLNLDEVTRAVALTSLIQALDRVDSTLGHFAAYLKDWSPRSFNNLHLEVPKLLVNKVEHTVTRRDVLDSCEPVTSSIDLAYFDPPYGSNNEKMPASRVRYQSYYHIWTTVIQNDNPELFGAARRRVDTSDSVAVSPFEEFKVNKETGRYLAVEALDELITKTPTPWILLSYSNGGRATAEELNEVLRSNGKIVRTLAIDYKRNVMSSMTWTNEWLAEAQTKNKEFLFLLKKR